MVNMNILATVAFAGLATAKTVEVVVAENGGLTFTPNKITAAVNDIVHFKLAKSGHDISSGPFDKPCKPGDNSLYSGKLNEGDEFSVNITSTDPIWLYCSVSKHCAKGMVAVINAPSSGNTIEAYKEAAAGAGNGQSPPKVNNGSGTPTTSGGAPAATSNAASSLTFNGAAALVAMGGAWIGLL
ncbi:hypothetical protein MGYG_00715 [Nannizzia gypsea CBS 118893]|uniref:Extracellular serine-rich protein n=1 Tax=Arthroderma gypseum (strain ATCC MYA-4604 / CBS 118893) TaxID=535722 RepID=E5R1C4_ARTGP|nr:hypothetical protein MGYG_00715 [Nannizzia gypsea CBS 118893]EFQ97675.1 hypothetical protein MGYG_00715 [Nannizzia gypsea CBS 118893]